MRFKIVIVIILFSYSNGFSQNSNLIDSLINNSIKLKAFTKIIKHKQGNIYLIK